jgi:tetratricopeptide (TPR) repeat protein
MVRTRIPVLLVALLTTALLPSSASAQLIWQQLQQLLQPLQPQQPQMQEPQKSQPSPWVGQRVMTVRPGLRISHTDATTGKQIFDGNLTDLVYTVLNEQEGWLSLSHRGVDGWLPGNEVVPLGSAVSHFSERIRLNPNDAFAYAARGRAWREEGELERALKDLNAAIRLEPKNALWYGNRGLVYDELDESDNALDDFDDAIRLDPKDAQHFNGRGMVYKADRKYDKAIADYTDALRIDPKLTDVYFNRANAHKAKGDYDLAIRDYTEAIKLDPETTDAYFNRANARKAKRDYAAAVRDLKIVIKLDSKDPDARGNLAWLLATCPDEKVRDGKAAVDHATRACEMTSWKSPYLLATLGAAYAEAGDFTQAIRYQEKALESSRYDRDEGDRGRQRIKQFKNRQPYREE